MRIEDYIKTDPKKSYWLIESGRVKSLNDVRATAENLWVACRCGKCSSETEDEFHVVPYTELVKDCDGDFLMYCPKEGNTGDENDWIDYISGGVLPPVLEEIFSETTFRTVGDCDDSCDEEEDDSWNDDYDAEDEEEWR